MKLLRRIAEKPVFLLVLGTAVTAAAHMRFGVGWLGWLAPTPFLVYLTLTQGVRSRISFGLAMFAAWTLAVLKIVSDPMPLAMAPLFAAPIAIASLPAYLLWARIRESGGPTSSLLAFPALMTACEWALHTFTPFASWGALGYTQVENLPLMQLASVLGLHGVSFVLYLPAAAVAELIVDERTRRNILPIALAAALPLAAAHVFGTMRLAAMDTDAPTALVSAVGTESTVGGLPLPGDAERHRVDDGLRAITIEAAQRGAMIVVWTEAASVVLPDEEKTWLEQTGELAANAKVHLVAAYVVPLGLDPLEYENKYVWFLPNGEIDHVYLKNHPVPGEPAVPGTPPERTVKTDLGAASGAICYDYDFSAVAAVRGGLGADFVALPSSDWRGIDPIHTQMAAFRAIEQGHSVLRSTRFGLSAGIDPYGRIRGWLSHFEADPKERILLVSLPASGVRTIYRATGDLPLLILCAVLLSIAVVRAFRNR